MLSQTSGKLGYTIYNKKGTKEVTKEFKGKEHHGCPDSLARDVVFPILYEQLQKGKISFFALKQDENFVPQGSGYRDGEEFTLDCVGEKQSYESVLPSDRCLVVFSLEKNFVWTPDAAPENEKLFYNSYGPRWLQRGNKK